jgi:hypothetical protein
MKVLTEFRLNKIALKVLTYCALVFITFADQGSGRVLFLNTVTFGFCINTIFVELLKQ